MKKELLTIITQAFYGNRVVTQINKEDMDRFILGYLSKDLKIVEPIDRTIIQIPGSKCVLVYNKYQEEKTRIKNKKWYEKDGYIATPLAVIPELNIEIYSRCIVCRMDEEGKLESIQNEDDELVWKYLAK